MNIKTQVATLVLLHIIPLELRYGHYIMDVFLSKLVCPELQADYLSKTSPDFTKTLLAEMLAILLVLFIPIAKYMCSVLFNLYNHTAQHEKTPILQEKEKPKPVIHWLSSVFNLLIPLIIFHSFFLILSIYIFIFCYCRDSTISSLNLFISHTILVFYASVLIIICYNINEYFSNLLLVIMGLSKSGGSLIEPNLSYIKDTLFPTS